MNARPERRKSSLAGESPIAPVLTPQPVQETSAAPSGPTTPAHPADTVTTPTARPKRTPPKISVYATDDDQNRIRGAIIGSGPWEGFRSLSEFVMQVTMAEVERLEQRYNGGKPFPPVGTREMIQGRPMGR